jgi:hypothetical protein
VDGGLVQASIMHLAGFHLAYSIVPLLARRPDSPLLLPVTRKSGTPHLAGGLPRAMMCAALPN